MIIQLLLQILISIVNVIFSWLPGVSLHPIDVLDERHVEIPT